MPSIPKREFDRESKVYIRKVGGTLQHIRESKDIAIADAAKSIGISSNCLQAVERGERDYSLKLLVEICEYYQVNVQDVV